MDFVYIDRIINISSNAISGYSKHISNYWEYIESAAQLCSFHIRLRFNFTKHTFLLKIRNFKLFKTNSSPIELEANISGIATNSFKFQITGFYKSETILKASVLIGTVDYDSSFNKEQISSHYRKVIKCLMKD